MEYDDIFKDINNEADCCMECILQLQLMQDQVVGILMKILDDASVAIADSKLAEVRVYKGDLKVLKDSLISINSMYKDLLVNYTNNNNKGKSPSNEEQRIDEMLKMFIDMCSTKGRC